MVINHLPTGMILQAPGPLNWQASSPPLKIGRENPKGKEHVNQALKFQGQNLLLVWGSRVFDGVKRVSENP